MMDVDVHADLEEFVAKRKADKIRSGLSEDPEHPSSLGGVIQEAVYGFLKNQSKGAKKKK